MLNNQLVRVDLLFMKEETRSTMFAQFMMKQSGKWALNMYVLSSW